MGEVTQRHSATLCGPQRTSQLDVFHLTPGVVHCFCGYLWDRNPFGSPCPGDQGVNSPTTSSTADRKREKSACWGFVPSTQTQMRPHWTAATGGGRGATNGSQGEAQPSTGAACRSMSLDA